MITNGMMATPKEFHLTYTGYIQKSGESMSYNYEAMLYRKLLSHYYVPGITIFRSHNLQSDTYYFQMFNKQVHLATGYMYMEDLEEFMEHGYNILSSNKPTSISFNTEVTPGVVTASTITTPIGPTTISKTTNTVNTTTKKDNIMNTDYDAATIDSMVEELLQKKAALADIESRWKKDEDFNDGDVIVVEYAYSGDDEEAKIYTAALLKTKVGWFTTLTNNLLGANKYSYIVKFFENIYVKKVTYLALSEGVVMFDVEDDFGI